jgi:predicted metal-dependent peptidase
MSSRIRSSVSKDLMEKEYVSPEERTQCLATSIYETSRHSPFLGSVLQCLNIAYAHTLPTAGILFNTDAKRWDMLVNPFFFCKKLSQPERNAVLLHELSHITHKHPMRVPFLKISARKRMLMNIAADMAINQFIKNLPTGCPDCPPIEAGVPCKNELCPGRCIDVKDYYDVDEKTGNKIPWPVNKTMEDYYERLIKRFDDPDEDDDGDGDGSGGGGGKGKGNAGGGAQTGDLPNTIDEHMWDGAGDEKEMIDATEELVKRAMVKARLSYDDLPGHVREMLDDLKARRAELNYKALIMAALKKHASGHNRKNTWTRKSKRFGNKAPGTKVGDLPKLFNFIDTSGSISIEEANEFLEIVDQFLRVGSRKCRLGMFHTELYHNDEYKLGHRIKREDIQNGGTDLTQVMQEILRKKPDLSVVITDGCYGDVNVEQWMKPGEIFPQTLFIISKGGTTDHPLKRLGDTIKIPDGSRT